MTKNTTDKIENQDKNLFEKILIAFFSIFLIRIMFDAFAFTVTDGYLFTFVHMMQGITYFSSIFLSFSLILFFLTKVSIEKIFIFLVKISTIIWVVPMIDLIVYKKRTEALYVTIKDKNFFNVFLKMLNPLNNIFGESTLGIFIAASITLFLFFIFIYKKTNKLKYAIVGVFLGYLVFFFHATVINLIWLIDKVFSSSIDSYLFGYADILKKSWLAKETSFNFLDIVNINKNVNTAYEIVMARIFWISMIIQASILFFVNNKDLWLLFRKNMRLERIFNYILISCIGIIVAYKKIGDVDILNPINILTLVCFFLLITLGAWVAVFINDMEDYKIDLISNPSRPFIKENFPKIKWYRMHKYLILINIFGLLIINKEVAFLLILWQGAYYLYSAQPLRLKSHFISSSIIMSFTTTITAMAGFFLVMPGAALYMLPLKIFFTVAISYAMLSNLKDLKDYDGDKAENIKTIPVVFGLKRARIIIAVMYIIVFLSIPVIFSSSKLLIFSTIASILSTYIIINNHNEKYIFYIKFVYMIMLFLLVF